MVTRCSPQTLASHTDERRGARGERGDRGFGNADGIKVHLVSDVRNRRLIITKQLSPWANYARKSYIFVSIRSWLNAAAAISSHSQNCSEICERDGSLYLHSSTSVHVHICTRPLTLQRLIQTSSLAQPQTHTAPPLVITAITRRQQLVPIRPFAVCFLLISSRPAWNEHRPSTAENETRGDFQ